jgi:hypothetical protein
MIRCLIGSPIKVPKMASEAAVWDAIRCELDLNAA